MAEPGFHHFESDPEGPGPLRGHTATSLTCGSRINRILFYGGYKGGTGLTINSQLKLYNLDTLTWETVKHEGQLLALAEATATKIESKVWIYGGRIDNGEFNNKIFYINTKTWTLHYPTVIGEIPDARAQHCAVNIGSKIYFFGGTNSAQQYLNQTIVFDTGKFEWSILNPKVSPCPRAFTTCAPYCDTKFILFGGRNNMNVFGDLWIFDSCSVEWSSCNTNTQLIAPKPRAGHSLTLISKQENFCNQYILFGGWDGTRKQGREVGAENDVWLLDFNSVSAIWEELPFDNPPIARDCHTCISTNLCNSKRFMENLVMIYGGTDLYFNYLEGYSFLFLDGILQPQSLLQKTIFQLLNDIKVIAHKLGDLTNIIKVIPFDLSMQIETQINFLQKRKKKNIDIVNNRENEILERVRNGHWIINFLQDILNLRNGLLNAQNNNEEAVNNEEIEEESEDNEMDTYEDNLDWELLNKLKKVIEEPIESPEKNGKSC